MFKVIINSLMKKLSLLLYFKINFKRTIRLIKDKIQPNN